MVQARSRASEIEARIDRLERRVGELELRLDMNESERLPIVPAYPPVPYGPAVVWPWPRSATHKK